MSSDKTILHIRSLQLCIDTSHQSSNPLVFFPVAPSYRLLKSSFFLVQSMGGALLFERFW